MHKITITMFSVIALLSSNYSYSGTIIPFEDALSQSKSIVVGTYAEARYGRTKKKGKKTKKKIPLTKHVFRDVTIHKKNKTKYRNEFVLQERNGIVTNYESLPVSPDNDDYTDDSGAAVEIGEVEMFDGTYDEVINELLDSALEFTFTSTVDLPEFVVGTRYILLVKKKKGRSPVHPYVFIVDEAGSVSSTDNTPLVDVVDGGLLYGSKPSSGIEVIANTGGEITFPKDHSGLPGIKESEFVRKVIDKLGAKK